MSERRRVEEAFADGGREAVDSDPALRAAVLADPVLTRALELVDGLELGMPPTSMPAALARRIERSIVVRRNVRHFIVAASAIAAGIALVLLVTPAERAADAPRLA